MDTANLLIIFSGLPASGKTTLAHKLASKLRATYLRVDTIEASLRDKTEVPELGKKCYRVAHYIARENLRLGNSVIGDSVNPWGLTRNEWNNVALSVGAKFVNIEVSCSNKDEHKSRLETRTSTVPELVEPTWKEIQDRDYHPWDQDRILIETSHKSVGASFDELISILQERLLIGKI